MEQPAYWKPLRAQAGGGAGNRVRETPETGSSEKSQALETVRGAAATETERRSRGMTSQ